MLGGDLGPWVYNVAEFCVIEICRSARTLLTCRMASSTGCIGQLLFTTYEARWTHWSAAVDEGIKLVLTPSYRAGDWVFFHSRILKRIDMKIGNGYSDLFKEKDLRRG